MNFAGRPIRYQGCRRRVWDKAVAVSRHPGHESIKITAEIYGDVVRASHQAAAEVIAGLLVPDS